MTSYEERLKEKKAIYARDFNIEDLNESSDLTLLNLMLNTEIMIEDFQRKLFDLQQEDILEHASDIKKLSDLIRDHSGIITTAQKTLAIDRKTRKQEETGSFLDYITNLKKSAQAFMDTVITKVYCPTCKVMVGRFAPTHDHTAFSVSFQCSQCKKLVRARREERDVLFDVHRSDREWRKKYRAEIVQAKQSKRKQDDDELIIQGDAELIVDNQIDFTGKSDLEEDLEL